MKKIFKIYRFNPEVDKKPYYKSYIIEVKPLWTILDCLNEIKWKLDGTLAFRRSCRSGICGSCAMLINKINRLACETQVSQIKDKNISIAPLKGFEVIKDLVVNWELFFNTVKKIKPYLIHENFVSGDKEYIQSPAEREKLDGLYECILCGACTSSCPSYWYNDEFIGPAALLKAYRFYADSRDEGFEERREILDSQNGLWRCHTIFNCVAACSKNLVPTKAIQKLKQGMIKQRKSFKGQKNETEI